MTAHIRRGWRATLGAVMLLWCTIFAQQSWALGLAEIDVTSALNERFSATIELLDTQGFQPSEIVVKMAAREDFDRIGVERFFFLTDLRFKVEPDANGNARVVVTSTRPVSEPYLNFIVEVLWPSGRLLKEYTVLLDPPNFSQASAPLVDRPSSVAQAPSEPTASPEPAATSSRQGTRVTLSPTESSQPTRQRANVDTDGTIMTTVDDTLWKIANRTREDQVTVNQQMLALQRNNPSAFIRGNINLLKAGYRLDLPTSNDAQSLSTQEADAQVAAHTQAWREGRTLVADRSSGLQDQAGSDQSLASQVDATPVQIDTNPTPTSGEGQVRILANSDNSAAASGSGGGVDQLIEERAALTRQVEDLSSQLDTEKELASNQVAVKDRQLEVKDQEIAQLQQQLSEMRSEMQKIAQSQNQNTRTPTPEPVPFWQTPIVLFGIIGVLILILVVLLVVLRRNRAEAQALEAYIDEQPIEEDDLQYDEMAAAASEEDLDDEIAEIDEAPTDEQPIEPTISEHEVLTLDDDDTFEAEGVDDADDSADFAAGVLDSDSESDEHSEGATDTETSDVIGEAEIYIAYGRYGQAANLLLGVLNKEPERHDVRLKLLETYVESNDDENFATHAEYLLQNSDDEDVLHACRELEAQLNDNRVVLDDDLETSLEDSAQATDEESEDLNLDLDDLGPFDLEDGAAESATTESAPEETAVEDDTSGEDDFTLEFDEPLGDANVRDDAGQSATEETESTGHSDDLGGDLGMDFDPDRDVADYPLEDKNDGELDDLLADLDADSASDTAEGSAEEESSEDGFTLDLEEDFGADTSESSEGQLETIAKEDQSESGEGADDGFEFGGSDEDVNETKLDLASAYIDMGDQDGARDILDEVVQEGSENQQKKAKELLDQLD